MERGEKAAMLVPMVAERTSRRPQRVAAGFTRAEGATMTQDEGYTIGELARLAGVTPRTIRFYTAEGLLPPPETRGRYARYGQAHLRRLERIAELKSAYLPLSAIRERLREGTPGAQPGGAQAASPGAPSTVGLPGPRRGRLAEAGAAYMHAGGEPIGGNPFWLTPARLQTGRVEFFPADHEPLDAESPPDAAPTRWQRVVLAPGVELHVREPISQRRRAALDALIAAARDQLRAEE